MDKRYTDSSKAFEASLSFGFTPEKVANYSLDKEDGVIEKYAGINIYQPTVDNIELFVRKYTLNELAFFPKTLNTRINFIPTSFDTAKKDYVKDGHGLVSIGLHEANIEIPFLIVDGELLPFDVIQMNKQRIPYSRENMKKVLFGVEQTHQSKLETPVDGFNPYTKTEQPTNPTTSHGFLGSVLQIQDQHMRRNGSDIYVTAESHLDSALEKVANLKELTVADYDNLENIIHSKLASQYVADMEKIAEEVKNFDDSKIASLFTKIDEMRFEDANSLPNGTVISFPEKHNNELVMTKGIIIDDYMDIGGIQPPKMKIVISNDGRIKILDNREKFLCFKADATSFHIPTVGLASTKEDDFIVAFDGNKALFPSVITSVRDRFYGVDSANTGIKVRNIKLMNKSSELLSLLSEDGTAGSNELMDEYIYLKIAPLAGAKFLDMPYAEYIRKKAVETGMDEMKLSQILSKNSIATEKLGRGSKGNIAKNLVFCTDEDTTKVIVIKGVINHFIRDKKELEFLADDREFEIGKTAATNEFVEVRCIDKSRNIFSLKIQYVDKKKRMFAAQVKTFDSMDEYKLRGILKALGYDLPKVSEIIFKAKSANLAHYELPADANIDAINGGNTISRAKDSMKKMKGVFLNDNVKDTLAAEVLGGLLTGASLATPGGRQFLSKVTKFASESGALSAQFEKVAQERKSKEMLKVAKIMATSSMFNEKVAQMYEGTAEYPMMKNVADEIVMAKPLLEKTAYELVELKVAQFMNKAEMVSPNYIQSAINNIDNMYKIARVISDVKEEEATGETPTADAPDNGEDKKKNSLITGANIKEVAEQGLRAVMRKHGEEEATSEIEKEANVITSTAKKVAKGATDYGKNIAGISGDKDKILKARKQLAIGTGIKAGITGGVIISNKISKNKKEASLEKQAKFGFGNKSQNFNAKNYFPIEYCASEELDMLVKEAGFGVGKGALVGSLAGAGIGAFKTIKQSNPNSGEDNTGNAIKNIAGGALMGATAGATAGAAVKGISNGLSKIKGVGKATTEAAETVKPIKPLGLGAGSVKTEVPKTEVPKTNSRMEQAKQKLNNAADLGTNTKPIEAGSPQMNKAQEYLDRQNKKKNFGFGSKKKTKIKEINVGDMKDLDNSDLEPKPKRKSLGQIFNELDDLEAKSASLFIDDIYELEKMAGMATVGIKRMRRGALLGGAIGGVAGGVLSKSEDSKKKDIAKGALAGAILGGGIRSDEYRKFKKMASMTIPTPEEKAKENGEADLTDGEYLEDIKCENCGYEGKPTSDGSCPNCGAILGMKPKDDTAGPESDNQTSSIDMDTMAREDSFRNEE